MKHVRWLTENTPKRGSGLGDDQKAAEYICEQMDAFGLENEIQSFVAYNSRPVYSELTVLEPERMIFDSQPCCHIQSTPIQGLTTELIDVSAGAEKDYQGKNVRGKAVLAEVSYSPPTPEKARIAAINGASAIICMNWGKDQQVICGRGLKAVWGNPTPQNIDNIPQIAGISISRKDGERLKELCIQNPRVKVHLRAEACNRWENLPQPVAILEAKHDNEEFVLISGHLDAWEPGVTCNATGNGAMLELARIFARHRDALKRNLIFAFWNGHEIAEAAGSAWYVDNNWDQLRDNCIANFTIDSPGIIRASRYLAYTSSELRDFTQNSLKDMLAEEVIISDLKKIGDQSFMGLGLPSIYGRMALSEKEIRENNGATLGWWNHTIEDTLDKADPDILTKDLTAYTVLIAGLANATILPYDFSGRIRKIKVSLNELNQRSGSILQLEPLIEVSNRLEVEAAELNHVISSHSPGNSTEEANIMINECLMKLSRTLTSPFQTACSRYDQDSYGLSDLSEPIPLLYPMAKLVQLPPSNESYHMLLTMLIKNRNRISDALKKALDLILTTKRLIKT
jgi:hypothetical protein